MWTNSNTSVRPYRNYIALMGFLMCSLEQAQLTWVYFILVIGKLGEKKSEGQRERHGYIWVSAKPCCPPPTGARAASTLHPTPTASGMADPNDPRREQPGKAATCFRLRLVNQLYQVACYCELIIAQSVTKQLKYYFMPVLQLAAQCLGHSIFLLTWSYGAFLLLNPTCK